MWDHEGFLAKAKLYFNRAAQHDDVDDEFALWLLLGMEFLLRAPLAKVHPSLLASPEGDSILHATGVLKVASQPRSIPTKTVVERLKYVIADFGQDRQKDAMYLASLRNAELHSAEATLRNVSDDLWLPRFLDVAEVVCSYLGMPIEDFIHEDILEQARALRVEVNKALERQVRDLVEKAKYFFSRLTPEEIEARRNHFELRSPPLYKEKGVECPACGSRADLLIAPGRATRSRFDEDNNEFVYNVVYVAKSFECPVCGLSLADTAMVTAAGIDRVHVETFKEGRYKGWEESVPEDEIRDVAVQFWIDDDYGND